jgi:adenosylmethionine-8-amino-7-oxononanoate aminotransferase
LRQRFIEHGAFIRPFGSIVCLTPALTITDDELAVLIEAVIGVMGEHG